MLFENFEKLYKMKLSTTFLIVFCLHIYWVCGDSTTIPSQSTVKSSVAVETNPAIVVERSDVGRNNESNVATSKLLEQKGEQEPVSKIGVGLRSWNIFFVSSFTRQKNLNIIYSEFIRIG